MTTLSEKDLELRDKIYDRLICGQDWRELAEVLELSMPPKTAKFIAYVYADKSFYGSFFLDELIEDVEDEVKALIKDYIQNWRPPEPEPSDADIVAYEEREQRMIGGYY